MATLVCLHSLARLASRFRWALYVSSALGAVLTVMGIIAIWGDYSSSGFWKAFGVVAILVGVFVLAVPILHRASRDEVEAPRLERRVLRFCPSCGRPLEASSGDAGTCRACGAGFVVSFENDRPGRADAPSR